MLRGCRQLRLKNYDLSMKVLARKMDNVQNSGAGILVSSCPACMMQLSYGVKTRKMDVRTASVVELLDEALGGNKSESGSLMRPGGENVKARHAVPLQRHSSEFRVQTPATDSSAGWNPGSPFVDF